ncbi:hypothetical protein DP49_5783 [Burkholderia pseudomallei]|nr:hypothetical protein DP49_5783 [Burkholderia pseudomallei]
MRVRLRRRRGAAPAARPVYCPARDGATPRRRRGAYETRRRRPSLSCRKLRFSSTTLPRCRAVVQSTFAYSPSDRSVACVKRLSMMSDPTRPAARARRAARAAGACGGEALLGGRLLTQAAQSFPASSKRPSSIRLRTFSALRSTASGDGLVCA